MAPVAESFESYEESFARELAHFHDCVVNGTECRTPPEQARLDMDVLTQSFEGGLRRLSGSEPLSSADAASRRDSRLRVRRARAAAVRDLGGTVVAFCSRTRAGAQLLADEVDGVPAYDSLEELCDARQSTSCTSARRMRCTPTRRCSHSSTGAHVVCETPLATSTARVVPCSTR